MNGTDFLKKSKAYYALNRDASEKRIAHAYMIISTDTQSADTLADLFLAECVIGNSDEQSVEKIRRGGYADVMRIPRGDKILVDDVKQVTDTVYFTPTELDKKFYIIDKFETANASSQNKLLKVLEEPPKSVVFIIKCANKSAVLPTVLSRVREVEIAPMPEEEITEYLIEKYGESPKVYVASALSNGYIGLAEEIMKGKKEAEMFNACLETLKGMKNSKQVLHFSVKLSAFKDGLSRLVKIFELLLCDCMRASTGARAELRFKSNVREITELSEEFTIETVLKLREPLLRAQSRLELNGNNQSVLDELLFSILEVKAKCRK